MQNDTTAFEPLVKKCHYCGKEIKRSAHRCPHCHESLAELDQQEWQRVASSDLSEEGVVSGVAETIAQILLTPFSLFILIAIAFLVTLSLYTFTLKKDRPGDIELAEVVTSAPSIDSRTVSEKASTPSETTVADSPLQKMQPKSEGSDQSPAGRKGTVFPDSHDMEKISPGSYGEIDGRKERIKYLCDEIFEELRKREAIAPDTLYLKSGTEIQCTITEESDAYLKFRSKGFVMPIEKERIDRIERRAPETVERGLREAALTQATRIVEEGLVRHGEEWITPEERDLRVHVAKTKSDIERLKARKAAGIPTPQPPEPEILVQKPAVSTTAEKVDYSAATVIEGFGFHDIVVGHPRCTRRFIKARLGEPDAEQEYAMDYEWKYGFKLIMASDADMLVEIHLGKRFKGKLLSNVSLSSSVDEIFRAYGRPATEEDVDDLHQPYYRYRNRTLYRKEPYGRLAYRDLGLLFSFERDQITQIVIHRI